MYKTILLDIDNTLFDYPKAEKYAIKTTFEDFDFFRNGSESEFEEKKKEYKVINDLLWEKLEKGEITSAELKVERFRMLFEKANLNYNPEEFSKKYLKRLGEGAFLLDGAEELCKYLYGKYRLGIVTNGMKEVQYSRVGKSSVGKYIDKIIISEEVGISKPNAGIFEYALKELGTKDKKEAIMIGDSLSADIQGGINFGIDTCWVNLKNDVPNDKIKPKYVVTKLKEICEIL